MKRISMGKMERYSPVLKGYILIKDWTAFVAEHHVEESMMTSYEGSFVADGMRPEQAKAKARMIVQAYCQYGYLRGLREAVSRRALEYARKWPDKAHRVGMKKRKPIYELQGFDPQQIQMGYIPFQIAGRNGLPYMQQMLADMAMGEDDA